MSSSNEHILDAGHTIPQSVGILWTIMTLSIEDIGRPVQCVCVCVCVCARTFSLFVAVCLDWPNHLSTIRWGTVL